MRFIGGFDFDLSTLEFENQFLQYPLKTCQIMSISQAYLDSRGLSMSRLKYKNSFDLGRLKRDGP